MIKHKYPCHWCGRLAPANKGDRAGVRLCEYCCDLFDYYKKDRECFVCGSRDGLKKMPKSGLILCQKHRAEQAKINLRKAVRKYARQRYVLAKSLTPEQRKEITKAVLCGYFSDLKKREEELVPVCLECGGKKDVVSVITKDGLKLLCADCRAKIYQRKYRHSKSELSGTRRERTALGIQCDRCKEFGSRKVRNEDLYLCDHHYREHMRQGGSAKLRCEKCGSTARAYYFNGYVFCSRHRKLFKAEKKKIPPVLRLFVIPFIRT